MANIRTLSDMHGGSGPASHNEKRVKFMRSESQITQEFANAGGKLVVIDFSASWCGPCKAISPLYAELSERYPDVVFLKVDVDELSAFSQKCGVRAMPTFHFYKNSQKITELQGANAPKLQQLVQEHSTPSSSTSAAPSPLVGQQLGSRSGSNAAQDEIQKELLEMGFEESLIKAARNTTPFNSLQDVIEWIVQQQSAPEQIGGSVPPSQNAPSTENVNSSEPSVPQPSQALTPEEIERQNQLLEQKLQALRAKKAKEEEEREHNREIMRRKSGKESQDALKKWEDEQANRAIEAVRREKEQEKIHKEAVRRKVEQNKINRMKKNTEESTTPSTPPPPSSSSTPSTTQSNSDSVIQIRLPNGQVTQANFQSTDSLQTIADHVGVLLQVQPSQLTLSTTYPRKSFTHADFNQALAAVGVYPRGQVIVKL